MSDLAAVRMPAQIIMSHRNVGEGVKGGLTKAYAALYLHFQNLPCLQHSCPIRTADLGGR